LPTKKLAAISAPLMPNANQPIVSQFIDAFRKVSRDVHRPKPMANHRRRPKKLQPPRDEPPFWRNQS
jgi:hypothetical protein